MATIGSIVAQFTADTGGLRKGVGDAVSYFQNLRDQITGASKDIERFNSVLSAQVAVANAALNKMDVEKSIRIDADASDLKTTIDSAAKTAADAIEGISKNKPAEIEVKADATSVSTASGIVRQFTSTASELFARTGKDVVDGAQRFDKFRISAGLMAGGVTKAYSEIRNASNQTANAVNAVGAAASAISEAGKSGFEGFRGAADATIVAAGRAYDAAQSLATAYKETVPAAATASVAGFRAFVAQLGGVNTLTRAANGSAAATAVTVGSLASAITSAATSIGVYAAVVTAARVASSGLSEEAQAYVERAAQVAGGFAGVTAAAMTAKSSYTLVAGALYSSSTATQFFQKMLQGLGQGIRTVVANSGNLINRLTQIQSVLSLVSAASNEKTTGLGFASLAARVSVTSVLFGGLAGGVRSYAAGATVATGVTAGVTGAISVLASTLPLAAAGALTAAVSTGKFSRELEGLGSKAESIEQMADRFGSSIEGVEKLKVAAANANVSMMALIRSQQNFYSNLSKVKSGQFDSQNAREAKIAFDELGIPVEKLKSLKPEESFRLVAKSLSEVKNAADRTRIAVDLFGARGAFALPALKEIGELEEDFNRLGGAIRSVDFSNILRMEASFDRLKNASDALGRTLLVPFVSLQRAFNNFSADLKGGLVSALAPLMTMLNSIGEPIAVIIESFGRMLNVTLRLIGIFTGLAAFFQIFATVAKIFEGIGEGFRAALAPLESLVELFSSASEGVGLFSGLITAAEVVLRAVGAAIGFVVGAIANVVIVLAAGAAAWGIYTAAMALASATSISAAVSFAIAWAAALGPILPIAAGVVAVVAAIGVAVMVVAAVVKAAFSGFVALGRAIGLVAKERPQVDATTLSTKELAASAREAQDAASWFSDGESEGKIAGAVDKARDSFNNLATESLRYGKAGSDTITSVQKRFADLEQSLNDGKISTDEFTKKTKDLFASASKGMKDYEKSAAVTLSKNLELYKQLDDTVRGVGKTVRDISAGTVVNDKFFPASDEVKRRAAEYKAEYVAAIEEIKKKQQSGGFQVELDQKRSQLDADLSSGAITEEQYASMKLELDSTSAQEQAKFASEEVQREFDRKTAKLKADISFADDIRKKLDEAFLSPVDKFEKELKKINDNPELTQTEKILASTDLRNQTRESLVGKSAQAQFQERTRDMRQAADAGLISTDSMNAELQKAAEDFAAAVGATRTPFEDFSSRIDNVTKQFGFAGQPLEDVREKLKGNAEQLALFDRAVQDARDSLLQSLGIEKTPQEVFAEQMKKIDEAVNAADPNKRITSEQAEQARAAANRKRDASFGIDDAASQTAERRKQIEEAFGGGQDPARFSAAMSKAAEDFASAVGVTKTPFESFSSSLDNIAKQFGFAGQPIDVVREKLKGNADQLALFDRAVKESRDNLLASLGIEKTPQQVFDDQIKKIDEAVNATDPNKRITRVQADQARAVATRKRNAELGAGEDLAGQFSERRAKIAEAFGEKGEKDPARFAAAQNKLDMDKRQAAGLDATPTQQLKAGIDKINDAFGVTGKSMAEVQSSLSPEEFKEYQEAIKKNSDAVKASLGVEKSGADKIAESREKLSQAVKDGVITEGEKNKALKEQRDSLLSSLGIQKTPSQDFEDAVARIKENAAELSPEELSQGLKEAKDKLLSSLGIDKSPAEQATESMKKLREAFDKGQISAEEFAKGSQKAKDALLSSLGIPLDPVNQLRERMNDLSDALSSGLISQQEFDRGQEEAKRSMLPGGEEESPIKKFQRDVQSLEKAASEGLIDDQELASRKLNLQAQLQEDLKPALDSTKQDRRGIEASDVRSKGGVDTFFRILRGNDNPTLKAQLAIQRNTQILADAAREPDAAPVIAQLSAR